jgi:DHA1 family bicyclomycin/chloramphenicol resistance-like MFS transporter
MLGAVLLFALLSWAGAQQPLAIFVPGMLLTFGNALALPNTTSSTISLRADIAGAASGLLSFVQLSLAAVTTQLVAVFANHTSQPPALMMLSTMGGAALCFGAILWGRIPSLTNLHAK